MARVITRRPSLVLRRWLPWVGCVAAELSRQGPVGDVGDPNGGYTACTHDNTHLNPYGANPDALSPPEAPARGRRSFEHPHDYYEHLHPDELHAHN